MSVVLSAFAGVGAQLFDNNGVPLAGGKIYTYAAGTTSPLPSYTDSTGGTAHTNPIILNSAGRVLGGEIWVLGSTNYKFVVTTSTDVLIITLDNIIGSGGAGDAVDNFSGTGSQTVFTLALPATNENTTTVYINGVYQQKNTYTVSGTTLTFSQAPPYLSTIEVMSY